MKVEKVNEYTAKITTESFENLSLEQFEAQKKRLEEKKAGLIEQVAFLNSQIPIFTQKIAEFDIAITQAKSLGVTEKPKPVIVEEPQVVE